MPTVEHVADREPLTAPSFTPRAAQIPIRVLSLTGGGYRGLFTAAALAELERRLGGRSVAANFDVFAGTSIGGLIACALAAGNEIGTIREALQGSGPTVFPRRRARLLRRLLGSALYDSEHLKGAIRACLGTAADTSAQTLSKGLLVTSLGAVSGEPRFFRSQWFGAKEASDVSLTDACLATSAAPTFFAPHRIGEGGEPLVDGGLVASSPDLLAIAEIERARPGSLDRIRMLSIGTAAVGTGTMAGELPRSGLTWGIRIVPMMMAAQERLAEWQTRELLRGRYVRVNHIPSPGQAALSQMDIVDDSMTATLLTLGQDAAKRAVETQEAALRQLWP